LVAVPVFSFMPSWLDAWVGPELAGASLAAQILVISLVANTNHLLAIPVMTAKGQIRPYAILHSTWAVLGILGSWLLGNHLQDVAGIAAGIVIPVLLLEPIYVRVALNRLEISTRSFIQDCLLRPFLLAIGASVGLTAWASSAGLGLSDVILVSLGWFVFGSMSYLVLMDTDSRGWVAGSLAKMLPISRRKQTNGNT